MSETAATALPLPSQDIPENPKPKTARAGVETLSHVSGIIGLADAGGERRRFQQAFLFGGMTRTLHILLPLDPENVRLTVGRQDSFRIQ